MMIALALLGATMLVELGLYLIPSFRLLRIGVFIVAVIIAVDAALLVLGWQLVTGILLGISVYRLVNLLRIVDGRMNERQLRRAAVRASVWLCVFQIVVGMLWWGSQFVHIPHSGLPVLLGLQVGLALLLLASTVRSLIKTRAPSLAGITIADKDLPTLTVAVPARNETNDLEACLASLIMSNYPKLEILVLDDCSQLKRTPEIIRSYAHAGVRFLQGELPPDNWLAKNYAYEQLYKAASGELIAFCGVDVRFTPESLRLLLLALESKHKDMISILPRNLLPSWRLLQATTLVQAMRYAWELALPRRSFSRPPVLSTCWVIRRKALDSLGGFSAVSRSINAESFFARRLVTHDGYSFMQSSPELGIASSKSLHEQHSTAVRVEYPRLRRRLELVTLLSVVQSADVVGPYVILVWALLGLLPQVFLLPSLLVVLLLTAAFSMVMTLTYRRFLLRSLIVLPVAAILDVLLLHESMLRYEFSEVVWKERNICIPVMHQVTVPQLPVAPPAS